MKSDYSIPGIQAQKIRHGCKILRAYLKKRKRKKKEEAKSNLKKKKGKQYVETIQLGV